MHSKGNAPTAEQKRWREEVRELGCIINGEKGGVEIHHVLGATAKHNKQPIGHEFILPLSTWYHRQCPTLNVTDHKHLFEANFGTQVALFNKLLTLYEFHYEKPVPLNPDVIQAIRDFEVKAVCV
jgi:hypothetical protein